MKKIILGIGLIILSLFALSQNYDVTVSGIVTDMYTGDPVQNQEMNILTDSLAGTAYYNTVYTDVNGFYIDTFNVTTGSQGIVEVYTLSCGMYFSQTGPFSPNGNQVFLDFQICSDSMNNCQAMFTYFPTNPMGIQFLDESLGNPNMWTWEFGDGQTSTNPNPEHTYLNPGEYDVILTIQNDSTQCSSTIVQTVFVEDSIWPGGCQAMWFAYPDSNDLITYIFEDQSFSSSGQIASWNWDFGDGTYSNLQSPVHTYGDEGLFEVCLTITDLIDSCESTYCFPIEVGIWQPDCEAMYYYYPVDSANNGGWNMNNMQFVDMSIGNPDSWYWDFDDGNTSTEQNPIHYFVDEGVYEVCLTITNTDDSCTSTFCDLIQIYNDTLPGCITWFDYTANDLELDFTAFLEGGTGNVQYDWSFGDGTTGTGETITHIYAEAGIYDVVLSSYDSSGCYTTSFEQIWVGEVTFDISGYVYLDDSSMLADYADVHLMTFDTLGTGLINIETTQTSQYGYYSFESVGLENCIYFVQAELTDQSAYYGQYLPTYHLDALNWEMAWPIFAYPINLPWSYDILMVSASSSNSGIGLINGTVTNQSGRTIQDEYEILLYNEQGEGITYRKTSESGQFDFSDLDYGTYTVYTEIVGITTEPVQVTLTEEDNEANIYIVVRNGEAVLGVDEVNSLYLESFDNIYPNPVVDNATLAFSIKENTDVNINIYNQFGQIVYSSTSKLSTGKQTVNLNISDLSEGIYMISISGNDNQKLVRKFMKLR